ncbi:MAG TPA: acyl-ACP thioesterase domain-containing protein [Tissierellaceae bacterium]
MLKYKKTFVIPYYEIDKNKALKPTSLLNILNEAAFEHSSISAKIDKMKEMNYAWMINRWKVYINKYPTAEEKITIETWTSNIDRFYAEREFLVFDEKDEAIIKASIIWIFVDISKRKPIKIPEEIQSAYMMINEKVFNDYFDFKEKIDIEDYIDFQVKRSEIDYNNHVNNTVYLNWMLETVPDEIYNNYKLREFEILYKKEIKYGDKVLSGIKELNYGSGKKFYHSIVNSDKNVNHAIGITVWEK